MLAKFVPIPLPPSWVRHTVVKSMKPTGWIVAVPMRNCRGDASSPCPGAGAIAGAAAEGFVAAVVITADVAAAPDAVAEFVALLPGIVAFIAASCSACSLIKARS